MCLGAVGTTNSPGLFSSVLSSVNNAVLSELSVVMLIEDRTPHGALTPN